MNVVTSTSDVNHHSDLDMDEEAWNVRLIGSFSATTIPKPLLAAFEKLYSLLEPVVRSFFLLNDHVKS
jgi:hypothetical protein